MAEHFINLNCANCGAKLDVYEDMERFACGYCGTQLFVQRRGGTVALKAVTDAIKKVQIGTDKTAAELALARLGHESIALSEELKKLADAKSADAEGRTKAGFLSVIFAGMGALLLFMGFLGGGFFASLGFAFGLALSGFSLFCLYALWNKKDRTRRVLAETQILGKQAELAEVANRVAERRRIVDSTE
jgi:DNA-directed RNA polymerase subunit RPC12/RpoP